MGSGFFEPVPIHGMELKFKPDKSVRSIKSLHTDSKMNFEEKDGWVELTINRLDDFDVMLVEYAD